MCTIYVRGKFFVDGQTTNRLFKMYKAYKHPLFLIFLLNFCSTAVQANTCANDNWGKWEDCSGCLRSRRRVCKTDDTVFQEELCTIGMYLVLFLCVIAKWLLRERGRDKIVFLFCLFQMSLKTIWVSKLFFIKWYSKFNRQQLGKTFLVPQM